MSLGFWNVVVNLVPSSWAVSVLNRLHLNIHPSIHRLIGIKEVGEVEEEVPVHDLISPVRRDIRNLSIPGKLR
jgi:hypothetical protein